MVDLSLENVALLDAINSRSLSKQTVFSLHILDPENIDVTIEDVDQALLLISSLHKSYDNFTETLPYGRETLTLDEVQAALNSKELKRVRLNPIKMVTV